MRRRRMYAISLDGVGLIGGTLAYTRKEAINHLFGCGPAEAEWEQAKDSGYRTVCVLVEVVNRFGRHRVPVKRKTK